MSVVLRLSLFAALSLAVTTSAVAETSAPHRRTCHAFGMTFAEGAVHGCSLNPGAGRNCPLGLPFINWTCMHGTWKPAKS